MRRPGQPAAEVHDEPGEDEVERGSPALGDDRAQDVAERAAADEERERLVLVGRPGTEKPAEYPGQRRRHSGRRGPESVHLPETRGLSFHGVQADSAASVLNLVPTYEYKCPNGHVFEVFKRIADPNRRGVSGLRGVACRDRALSRAGAFSRLRFLLDRLRPRRTQAGPREGVVLGVRIRLGLGRQEGQAGHLYREEKGRRGVDQRNCRLPITQPGPY